MWRGAFIAVATLGIVAITLIPSRVAADREHAEEIEQALIGLGISKARYLAAIDRADAETMVDLCTNDVVVVSPEGVAVPGNRNVGRGWYEFFQAGNRIQQRLTKDHLEVAGDVATETGSFVARIQRIDKPSTLTSGRYAIIWKREDYSWKCYRLFLIASKMPHPSNPIF